MDKNFWLINMLHLNKKKLYIICNDKLTIYIDYLWKLVSKDQNIVLKRLTIRINQTNLKQGKNCIFNHSWSEGGL